MRGNRGVVADSDHDSYRRIWTLAWPTVVYSLLELSVGFADLVMVRELGHEATAAIGLNRQITFLVEAAALAVTTGVLTLVSQGVGAGNRQQVDGAIQQSMRLVMLLSVPTTLLGYIASRPLLGALQASAETMTHGAPYLQIYFLGTVFLWINLVAAAIYRGTGDAVTPLKLASVVAVLNVVLNYVFIFGTGPVRPYGVAGAAIGTISGRAIGAVVYLALLARATGYARLPLHSWQGFDSAVIRRVLRVGTPLALAGIARNGARIVFLGLLGVSTLGASIQAAVGVGLQVRLLSVLPALAFQVAAATLVGQAVGGRDFDRAEALGQRAVVLLALIMGVVAGATFVLAHPLASLFIVDSDVAALGVTVLRWFAVAQFFSALSICTQGALTGAGDTKPILLYTIATQWGVLLVLTLIFLVGFGWEIEGPLLAWVLAPALQLVLMQRLFRGGRWKRLRV